MALHKRTREQLRAHCDQLHDDDGVDPREYFKPARTDRKENRKALQLCRQVADTLDQILSGESRSDVLRALRVADVVPAPDASRLLVTLVADCAPADFNREFIEAQLNAHRGRLRSEVAAAITRRKAPTLVFEIIGRASASAASRVEDTQ